MIRISFKIEDSDKDQEFESEEKYYAHLRNARLWSFFSGVAYFIILLVLVVVLVMEIKNNYHTDFFQGLGTPIDDWYNGLFK